MDEDINLDEKKIVILLQLCEAEISKLLHQLEQQHNLKSSLEQKLVAISSLTPPTTSIAPTGIVAPAPSMAHMPEEILLLVFSELTINNPLSIGPSLLVCHRWKTLICNSPLLWSRIPACLVPHPPTAKRWVDYTVSAIRYSGNAPLHLAINIPSFLDFWVFITLKLLDFPSQYRHPGVWVLTDENISAADNGERIDEISNWLRTANRISRDTFLLLEEADSAIFKGMVSISNATSSSLFRLRSLTLRFHAGEFTDRLSDSSINLFSTLSTSISTTTPMLEELTVIDDGSMLDIIGNVFKHPIPSLVRLFWGVPWSVTSVLAPTPLGRLTHLRMWLCQDLPPTEYTCSITHLFLDCTSVDADYIQEGKSFYFPQLEDLTLDGHVIPGFIEAPSLTTLRLIDSFDYNRTIDGSPDFPLLTRLHVRAYRDELENLGVYISQLPLLKEVGLLCLSKEDASQLKDRVKDYKISTKAYLYVPDSADWSFPAYENDEILFD